MKLLRRTSLLYIVLCLNMGLLVACGDAKSPADNVSALADAASPPAAENIGNPQDSAVTAEEETKAAASFREAFARMAASQGIYMGEVPEGFPLAFLPLYPNGEIEKSAIRDGDFTLLQLAPADKDTVFAWYSQFYRDLGWNVSDPITVMGRTMTGFIGGDAKVDMTMIDREGGKTFVALVLSQR